MVHIDATNAQGMDVDIPLRLCLSLEIPLVRANWFSLSREKSDKTAGELLMEQLKKNNVPFVIIQRQFWVFWAAHWCSCECCEMENEFKYYLLVYRTIH